MSERIAAALTHRRSLWLTCAVFAALLLVWWPADAWLRNKIMTEQRTDLSHRLLPYAQGLSAELTGRFALFDGLAAFVAIYPRDAEVREHFADFALGLLAGKSGIRAFQVFLREQPVIVYPVAGNEAVAGRRLEDLLNDERPMVRADVQRAIETRDVTISGPYELRQRGLGLVMRQAVFAHGQLRGMITMILDLPPLIKAARLERPPQGLEWALRDGSGVLIFGEKWIFASAPISQRIALPEGAWELAAIPKGGWDRRTRRDIARSRALGLIVVGLISALVFSISSRHSSLERSLGESTAQLKKELAERKRAEEALQQSEERYRSLLEKAPVGIAVHSEGKILYINPAGARLLGAGSALQIVGKPITEFVHPDGLLKSQSRTQRMMDGERGLYPVEDVYVRLDGIPVDVEVTATALMYGGQPAVQVIVMDITERRRLEDQLRHAQKLEGIGQLAGGIAHDFNNVLGGVLGFAGVLQMRIPEGAPLRHFVDEIVAAGKRGAELTRQILAFSRKQVFDLKPARLNGIVRDLEKMLRRLLPESIEIAHDLSGEDPVVLVDAGQIGQVLLNLVTNARDAIAETGRIGITTGRFTMDRSFVDSHGYGEPGEYAVLAVSDTGRGMDAATRTRIFEPFFTTKQIGKGTGLGLAVAHGIVKQHHGFIEVSSEAGTGTVIRVYLPLTTGVLLDEKAIEPQARVVDGNETILVAEDDAILRKLSRMALSDAGYIVIEAEDGEDAVAKFAANQNTIRLVLLDGLMPKKGGIEALEEIRRLCPGIKAVFMSGYANDIFSGGALPGKAAAFIQKPVMPADLLSTVREVLDR